MREFGSIDFVDGGLKFLVRGCEVLQKGHFTVKLNDEGFIFIFAQDLIEESATGSALLVEDTPLAHAGVDKQTEGEREIGFLGEVGNGLRLAILLEDEVVLRQIANDAFMFIVDRGNHVYSVYI